MPQSYKHLCFRLPWLPTCATLMVFCVAPPVYSYHGYLSVQPWCSVWRPLSTVTMVTHLCHPDGVLCGTPCLQLPWLPICATLMVFCVAPPVYSYHGYLSVQPWCSVWRPLSTVTMVTHLCHPDGVLCDAPCLQLPWLPICATLMVFCVAPPVYSYHGYPPVPP